jgi:hypothetical protein
MSTNINKAEFTRTALRAAQVLDSEADVFATMNADTGAEVLTAQQWQAINLLVIGKRQAEIAQELDVSQETLSRWKASPVYVAALNMAVRDCYAGTIGQVRDIASEAVDALRGCLQSADERVRLSAALALVKLHLQLDARALALPTTPASIANERLRQIRSAELDELIAGI